MRARLRKTGNPELDNPDAMYRVRVLQDRFRFELLDHDGMAIRKRYDASLGSVCPRFPHVLMGTGNVLPTLVSVPLIFIAASIVAGLGRVPLDKKLLCFCLAVLSALAAFGVIRFFRPRATIKLKVKEFRDVLKRRCPHPKACERGARRAVTAKNLHNLHEFFQTYILDRDMYYVSSNIIKSLTSEEKLSFAELSGPADTTYFISHYWGTPFQDLVSTVVGHAELIDMRYGTDSTHTDRSDWRTPRGSLIAYWICSLSNNQWRIDEELGSGDWAQSSFFLALTRGDCNGTLMVVDDRALPLTRAWCLFEVLQTCILEHHRENFKGLLLGTPSGVLNYGGCSVDTAMAIAERLASLRLELAEATRETDKRMICDLVESYEGGFEAMNSFVRGSIRKALLVIKDHHNANFERLVGMLEATPGGGEYYDADAGHTPAPRMRRELLVASPSYGFGSQGSWSSDSSDFGVAQFLTRSLSEFTWFADSVCGHCNSIPRLNTDEDLSDGGSSREELEMLVRR